MALQPSNIVICMGNAEPLVTIRPDGTIEYGPNYTPDVAAKAFWDAIGVMHPNRR
jgi:hypothetical protein